MKRVAIACTIFQKNKACTRTKHQNKLIVLGRKGLPQTNPIAEAGQTRCCRSSCVMVTRRAQGVAWRVHKPQYPPPSTSLSRTRGANCRPSDNRMRSSRRKDPQRWEQCPCSMHFIANSGTPKGISTQSALIQQVQAVHQQRKPSYAIRKKRWGQDRSRAFGC
jgi:hypothetical protein